MNFQITNIPVSITNKVEINISRNIITSIYEACSNIYTVVIII